MVRGNGKASEKTSTEKNRNHVILKKTIKLMERHFERAKDL